MMPKITPRGRLAAEMDDDDWDALLAAKGMAASPANPSRSKPRPKKKSDHMVLNEIVQYGGAERASARMGADRVFYPTFSSSFHEREWILQYLGPFYDDNLLTDVLRRVKAGKEATVYCCAANPATGAELLAAKVYRPRMFRQLRNDSRYRQGRSLLDERGKVVRDERLLAAVAKKTSTGMELTHTSWIEYEYHTLQTLFDAGADVPRPIARGSSAILMEYVGEVDAPAPLLQDVRLEPGRGAAAVRAAAEQHRADAGQGLHPRRPVGLQRAVLGRRGKDHRLPAGGGAVGQRGGLHHFRARRPAPLPVFRPAGAAARRARHRARHLGPPRRHAASAQGLAERRGIPALKRSASLELLLRYLRPHWRLTALLALLLGGSLALQLTNPQVIRYFLDTTQSGGSQNQLLLAAAAYLLFALGQQALGLGATLAGQRLAWRATNALRRDLALHCLRLDQTFHKTHTPGEMIERLNGDVSQLAEYLSTFSLHVVANGLLVTGILALLFAAEWRAGAALSVYVVVTLVVLASAQGLAAGRWAAANQASAEISGFVEERLTGADDIRAAGAVAYMLYRLQARLRGWMEKFRAAFMLRSLVFNFTNLLSVIGYALGLALAALLYSRREVTIGTAYLIVAYAGMLASPVQNLRHQARQLQQAGGGLQRINALSLLQPKVASPATARTGLAAGALPAEFERVSFAYDEAEPVLRGVTFRARPGRVLGVLGRTGSGKTTLARLLFRFYDPVKGAVRIGGEDLRELKLDELRARVGMVTQDVQLFQASIRDNLTFFNPHRDDDALWRALEALQLGDWVRAQPQGLDTPLAAGGQGLSAGEAQLLAFTRVFLHDPGLVILDEASSRLDPATENRLERAIDRLLAGRTAILIAHRLQTVSRADDILILENGQVAEHGRREALAADPGSRFSGLLNTGLQAALA